MKRSIYFAILPLLVLLTNCPNPSGPTAERPAAPSNLVASPISDTIIDLNWQDNSNNEEGFRIERKDAAGEFKLVGTVGTNGIYHRHGGLSSGTNYVYRVAAYNRAGTSPFSNEANATTLSKAPEIEVTQNDTSLPDATGSFGFSAVQHGQSGPAVPFTISNQGSADLILDSVALTAGDVGDFVIDLTGMVNTIIPASDTSFTVTFTPGSSGSKSATVTIMSNDGDEGTYTFTVEGLGTVEPVGRWDQMNWNEDIWG
jgi:hypothetical protein